MGRAAKAKGGRGSEALVERDTELEAIAAAIGRGQGGEGSLVLIEGPAGIGKTALLRHAEQELAHGVRLMAAAADELETELPFGLVDQLIGDLIESTRTAGSVLGEQALLRTIHLAFRRLESLAADEPLLLLIDDVHWADAPSLQLLNYLARRLAGLGLVVLATRRTTDEIKPQAARLLGRLSQAAADVLEPAPLSAEGVGAVLRADVGPKARGLAAECVRETGGNPLLLRWLVERIGAVYERGDVPISGEISRLVETDADQLVARLLRLGCEATALAQAISVLNADATLERAALVAGLEHRRAAQELGRIQRAGIIDDGEPLRFTHPLVKTAVHGAMTQGERAGLAHSAAGVLLETGAATDRVAARLLEAGGSSETWALEVLERAAEAASAGGSPHMATRYLRLADAVPQPAERRARINLRLAQAEALAGEPGYEERFERALVQVGDPMAQVRTLSELAGIRATRYEAREAIELLLRAIELLAAADPELETQLVAQIGTVAQTGGSPPPRAIQLVGEHIGAILANPPQELSSAQRMLLAQAAAHFTLTMTAGREQILEIVRPLTEPAAPQIHQAAIAPLLIAVAGADQLTLAERLLDRSIADAGKRGAIAEHLQMLGGRALVKIRLGNPAGALEDVRDGIAQAEEIGFQVPIHAVAMGLATLEAEGPEAARSLLDAEDPLHWQGTLLGSEVEIVRGRIRAALGDPAGGLAMIVRGGEALGAKGVVNPSYHLWRSPAALAALAAGERDRARELAESELELARRFGSPRAIGIGLRALGLVTGGGDGLGLLGESVAVLDGSEATLAHASSLIELGSAERRARQPGPARESLEAGLEIAHSCRAAPLVERALSELETLGLRRSRPRLTGVGALTPAELRTARMASGGMPNKEIASSLFLALRTVESHLTSTYKKLGIASRGELAGALGEDEPAIA